MSPARLKLIGALLLLASLALPQYTCARLRAPDGSVWDSVPPGKDATLYRPFTERHYAYENIELRDPISWLTLVAFGWPLILTGVRRRFPGPTLNRVLWWLEPVLAGTSGYLILVFSSLGDRAIGAYVGLAALVLLLLAWLAELRAFIADRRKARAAP